MTTILIERDVALRRMFSCSADSRRKRRGWRASELQDFISILQGSHAAMFSSARTACPRTSSEGEVSSLRNSGTALAFMSGRICTEFSACDVW